MVNHTTLSSDDECELPHQVMVYVLFDHRYDWPTIRSITPDHGTASESMDELSLYVLQASIRVVMEWPEPVSTIPTTNSVMMVTPTTMMDAMEYAL